MRYLEHLLSIALTQVLPHADDILLYTRNSVKELWIWVILAPGSPPGLPGTTKIGSADDSQIGSSASSLYSRALSLLPPIYQVQRHAQQNFLERTPITSFSEAALLGLYRNLIISFWAYAPLQFGRLEPNAHTLYTPPTHNLFLCCNPTTK